MKICKRKENSAILAFNIPKVVVTDLYPMFPFSSLETWWPNFILAELDFTFF